MMPSEPGVTTLATPSDREVVITRVVEARRELVFDIWTKCEHLRNWMGPKDWTMSTCEIDLRPGGAWRWGWSRADGSAMELHGTYREISPPDRLVSTDNWGGDWPETLNTTTFAEDRGRTTITLTILYPSKEARDAALQTGMKEGMDQSYGNLDAYLHTLILKEATS